MEQWRDIPGYEGYYQVSDYGNVRSVLFVNNIVRKPRIKNLHKQVGVHGRIYVSLYKDTNRKNCTVHRLVANAFIPNPNNYPEVNHIDGNPQNNNVRNLEWCTKSYNEKHAYHNGLQEKLVAYNNSRKKPIVRNDGKEYSCAYEAADDLGVTVFSVRDVLKGRINTVKGYSFTYAQEAGRG